MFKCLSYKLQASNDLIQSKNCKLILCEKGNKSGWKIETIAEDCVQMLNYKILSV